MKKIMFNDKYGLTQAVLEGRKTQTRRIINGLPSNTEGIELIVSIISHREYDEQKYMLAVHTTDLVGKTLNIPYQVGEDVAIAQKYSELEYNLDWVRKLINKEHAGWNNKLFVSAKEMPHRIRITNIRVERLQDISDDDCFKEGVYHDSADGAGLNWISCKDMKAQNELLRHEWHDKKGLWFWDTPQGAFAALIDKLSGKGTWKSNPWVFVYDFELVD